MKDLRTLEKYNKILEKENLDLQENFCQMKTEVCMVSSLFVMQVSGAKWFISVLVFCSANKSGSHDIQQ